MQTSGVPSIWFLIEDSSEDLKTSSSSSVLTAEGEALSPRESQHPSSLMCPSDGFSATCEPRRGGPRSGWDDE